MKAKSNFKLVISLILLTLFICYSSISYSQEIALQNTKGIFFKSSAIQKVNADEKMPFISVGFNPAGFLLLGPSIHADIRLFNHTYFSAYYIYHSVGILSGSLIFDDNPREYCKNCMGFGLGIKQLIRPNEKMNAWYIGLFGGYSYNQAIYGEGTKECTEKVNSIIIAANFGRKWNITKNLYFCAGVLAGTSYGNNDKVYSKYVYNYETANYDLKERIIEDWSGDIYPYVIPELTIGIQF